MGFHQLTGRVVHHPINATLEKVTATMTQIALEALDAETITVGQLDYLEAIGAQLPIVAKVNRIKLNLTIETIIIYLFVNLVKLKL